jgi:hypothetical protein
MSAMSSRMLSKCMPWFTPKLEISMLHQQTK